MPAPRKYPDELRDQAQRFEFRRSGLTRDDLGATLCSHGIRDLSEVSVAVFETSNGLSVLRPGPAALLWQRILPEQTRSQE